MAGRAGALCWGQGDFFLSWVIVLCVFYFFFVCVCLKPFLSHHTLLFPRPLQELLASGLVFTIIAEWHPRFLVSAGVQPTEYLEIMIKHIIMFTASCKAGCESCPQRLRSGQKTRTKTMGTFGLCSWRRSGPLPSPLEEQKQKIGGSTAF